MVNASSNRIASLSFRRFTNAITLWSTRVDSSICILHVLCFVHTSTLSTILTVTSACKYFLNLKINLKCFFFQSAYLPEKL